MAEIAVRLPINLGRLRGPIEQAMLLGAGAPADDDRISNERTCMGTFDEGIGVIEPFCEDLAAGKAFYQNVFGLIPVVEDDTSVMFEMGETCIILNVLQSAQELVGPRRIATPDAGSRKCFTIAVPDVDAVCAELTGKGVQILAGPVNRRWGKRTANFADPGGHLYEIAGPIPVDDQGERGSGPVDWSKQIGVIELFYPDLAAASAFYQDVFALPVDRADDTSVSFVLGEHVIILLGPEAAGELIAPVPVANLEAGVRMCFTVGVPDVDAACAELTSKGVQILGGPTNRSWGPYVAWFADPGGHVYEIVSASGGDY
jgi:catechol 2,3-dioxygenase-like lactoylglutathione lyase family enzyme